MQLTINEKKFTVLFIIIVLCELITANVAALLPMHYFAKPAIVLSLILFFYTNSKALTPILRRLTLLALVLSVIGDTLLMFVQQSPHFFSLGLFAFLVAHIMYVLLFLKHRETGYSGLGILSVLLIYGIGLFFVIKDGLGDLLIPVALYMVVILCMAFTAYLRALSTSAISYSLVFIGAIFFMVSDSLLAINKFHKVIPYASYSIMVTYAAVQYLIVLGILKIRVTNSC